MHISVVGMGLICVLVACDAGAPDGSGGAESAAGGVAGDAAAGGVGAGTARATVSSSTAGRVIGPDRIGHARAGMTIGALRAALPAGHRLAGPVPFMVDLDGMPVIQGADTLYYVLIPSGESSADDAPIALVATVNETFRTIEGVGPGTSLATAAAAYGAPTLSYSTDDESREYAAFPALPATIRVRVAPGEGAGASFFAGMYAGGAAYNETTEYDPTARIMMVFVDLAP